MKNAALILWMSVFVGLWSLHHGYAGEDDVAVIIGNQSYSDDQIPAVPFALRDAAAMKAFAEDSLEIPPENILLLENATQAALRNMFGSR